MTAAHSEDSPKTIPLRPRMATRTSTSFAIVASQYNLEYTQSLVEYACKELTELEPHSTIRVFWAPGSFEIPVLVKLLAKQGKYEAILALGVLFDGETAHADLVARSVTEALQGIAVEKSTPVLNGVLLMRSAEQARARCFEGDLNRGVEVARAAVAVARTVKELQGK